MLSDLRAQLVSFEGRYLRQVGVLYKKLDAWEQKIAELHGRPSTQENEAREEEVEPVTSQAVDFVSMKAVFRKLVKLIHPDFATDDADDLRRTRLMSQANDALHREDGAALKRMLNGYDSAITVHSASGASDEVTRLLALIFQVTQDTEAVNLQIEEIQRSESAKLQERVLEAARQGRDLLAEMAARVKGTIGLTMRRYELDLTRIAQPAKGPSVEDLVTAETSRA